MSARTCSAAASGCNFPEGGCLGLCMGHSDPTYERLIELVIQAVDDRSNREWRMMDLSLSEAYAVAKILQKNVNREANHG